jgi:hypothetical protein
MSVHHDTLGIPEDSSPEQVKKAYRKLARTWHPDVNKSPEAGAKFAKIQSAYEALMKGGSSSSPSAPGKPQTPPTAPKGRETVKYYGAKDTGPRKPSSPIVKRPTAGPLATLSLIHI